MKKNQFSKRIYSKNSIAKIEKKIKLLGVNSKYDTTKFLNSRLLICILVFFLSIYAFEYGYITGPILTLLTYLLYPYFTLDVKIKKRIKKLENEAMYFFEILTLSLESGKNLNTALKITTDNINSELSDEFKVVLEEIKLGKSFDEALDNLKTRIPSDAINNIILNISQANIFGNNIVETLYNQVDFIREKKMMNIKEEMNKIPIKVSVLSVLFFVPIILLLILGPVILELIG